MGEKTMDELLQMKKRFARLGLAFMVATIIINVSAMLLMWLLDVVAPEILRDNNMRVMLSSGCIYLLGVPVAMLILRSVPTMQIERKRMRPLHFIVAAFITYGIVYASNLVGTIVTTGISYIIDDEVTNPVNQVLSGMHPAAVLIFMVLLAPIMEELLFRKWIVDKTIAYGEGIAVLLSGIIFGLFHGNLNQFAYAFCLGTFFAFIYAKTGNIKITIALHMMVNFVGGFLPMLLFNLIDVGALEQILGSLDTASIVEFVNQNLIGTILYIFIIFFVIFAFIVGMILLLIALIRKKFTFQSGEKQIPEGIIRSLAFGNWGMLLYICIWLIIIVWHLV